jgi:DNA-directed RNA polymerase specialized sigma24 family protein
MSDKAKSWVWDYEKNVKIVCKKLFPQALQTEKDMVHEVLLRIAQRNGLDQVGDRSSWIYTVAYNECMNYFRELKRRSGGKDGQFERHCCGYCGLAFGSMAEIKDHIKENPEHNEGLRFGAVHQAGPRPDYHLPRGDDDDSGVESEAGLEDVEHETDESEKIDPMKIWDSFQRHEPDRTAALEQSLSFVAWSFGQIRGQRRYNTDYRLCRKMLATLRDITRRLERKPSFKQSVSFFGQHSPIAHVCQQIREIVQETQEGIGNPVPDMTIYFVDRRFTTGPQIDRMNPYFIEYHIRRPKDFTVIVPDPLYVLYRIWNRILRKGTEGKYGNRKLLKVLFFAFQKIAQEHIKDDTVKSFHDDTFNSLTEETNFETLRVMSYQLNKGYSGLADFIFEISIHPPSRAKFKKSRSFRNNYVYARQAPSRPAKKKPTALSPA